LQFCRRVHCHTLSCNLTEFFLDLC
jgi:hypothetical protein